MFNSPIIDVAIGLAFIFLLLSLLVSAVCEILAGILRWRAANLWSGLEHLLQSSDARDKLYGHPLIRGLAPMGRARAVAPADGVAPKARKDGPSYIPSRAFALALIDVIREPHEVAASVRSRIDTLIDDATRSPSALVGSVEKALGDLAGDPSLKPRLDALKGRIFAAVDPQIAERLKSQIQNAIASIPEAERAALTAVVDWTGAPTPADYIRLRADLAAAIVQVVPATPAVREARARLDAILAQFTLGSPEAIAGELRSFVTSSADVRNALDNANASFRDLARALSPMLEAAAGDIEQFRENVEGWFNDGMDRVAGWYKRHTMVWQAGIGLALALGLNIDALLITRTLWRDPALRASLVSQAQAFSTESPPPAALPPTEVSSADPQNSAGLAVTLSTAELVPDAPLPFTIRLKDEDRDRQIDIEGQTEHVELSPTPASATSWKRKLDPIPVTKGTTEVHALARLSGAVTMPRLETFRVTVTGRKPADGATTTETVPANPSPLTLDATVLAKPAPDAQFESLRTKINALGLPIGWKGCDDASTLGTPLIWCDRETWNWLGLFPMLLGWLITAAAVSLGAPFWFDTLKRVISIRSAGKAPEERPLKPKEVPKPREPGER